MPAGDVAPESRATRFIWLPRAPISMRMFSMTPSIYGFQLSNTLAADSISTKRLRMATSTSSIRVVSDDCGTDPRTALSSSRIIFTLAWIHRTELLAEASAIIVRAQARTAPASVSLIPLVITLLARRLGTEAGNWGVDRGQISLGFKFTGSKKDENVQELLSSFISRTQAVPRKATPWRLTGPLWPSKRSCELSWAQYD